MSELELTIFSEEKMLGFASDISNMVKLGDVIFLKGNLGVGKTTFAREFIRSFAADKNLIVPSPTFTILQCYDDLAVSLWHFDLYRIKHSEEILDIGIEEAITSGITIIEWPERLGGYNIKNPLIISMSYSSESDNYRKIKIEIPITWHDRMLKDFCGDKS